MAPAQRGGVGKQQDGNGDELGAKAAKGSGEGLPHQGVVLHVGQHCAALQVHHAGGQDDQGGEGAHHDGIGKHLKHTPHALMHRLLDVGSRIDHNRRAKARLIGEGTALEAPGDGLADAVAQRTAAGSLQVEGALENGHEGCRDVACVHHHDDQRTGNVEQRHERHQLFGDRRHTLQAADDDERRDHHEGQTGDDGGHPEGSIHVAGNGVELAHVADAEGRQNAEAGKQHGQHLAQLLAALLCAQTVGEVVHGTAGPLAFFIFAAVVHTQHVLRKAGHHAQQRHDPHPEDGPRPAGDDGRGHAHDVAGADGARQRCTHALELADGHVLLAGVGGDVLVGKDGSDSVPEPVAHFAELEKSGAHRHDQAGAEQQRQTRRAPDHSVHCIVDLRDPFQHGKFPPLTQNKKADRTHQRLCLQNSGAFIFRCRARRIPGGALVRIRRWLCPFA